MAMCLTLYVKLSAVRKYNHIQTRYKSHRYGLVVISDLCEFGAVKKYWICWLKTERSIKAPEVEWQLVNIKENLAVGLYIDHAWFGNHSFES